MSLAPAPGVLRAAEDGGVEVEVVVVRGPWHLVVVSGQRPFVLDGVCGPEMVEVVRGADGLGEEAAQRQSPICYRPHRLVADVEDLRDSSGDDLFGDATSITRDCYRVRLGALKVKERRRERNILKP